MRVILHMQAGQCGNQIGGFSCYDGRMIEDFLLENSAVSIQYFYVRRERYLKPMHNLTVTDIVIRSI
uniref:Tubulin/FtsZ GTPase domain-containing protein n=1 Tax=Glossina palpalis gambiensis TaxID=67801 RepID=A0A1B0BG95_9MUSC